MREEKTGDPLKFERSAETFHNLSLA